MSRSPGRPSVGGPPGGTAKSKPPWGRASHAVTSPQVYDGRDSAARPLGTFTKSELMGLTLNSTSNHLRLEFTSNGSDTAQGFQLAYTSE